MPFETQKSNVLVSAELSKLEDTIKQRDEELSMYMQ